MKLVSNVLVPNLIGRTKNGNSRYHLIKPTGDILDEGHRVVFTECGTRRGFETLQVVPIAEMSDEQAALMCPRCMKHWKLIENEDDIELFDYEEEVGDLEEMELSGITMDEAWAGEELKRGS